jgi:hypothetical protein
MTLNQQTDNDNFIRYVGYETLTPYETLFFSQNTVNFISKKVTELLQGVDPFNRKIIVPDKTIKGIMNDIFYSFRPPTGDIYSRYIVTKTPYDDNYFQQWVDQVIEVIVSDVRNNLGFEQNNSKLNIWDTVYGENNSKGLRAHAPITIRNRHPEQMQFNMNY